MSLKKHVLALRANDVQGNEVDLMNYAGQAVLIVNTASACIYTSQYQGLETLYRELHTQGFNVLAFPCNQFGLQESGSNADIAAFCEKNFAISFPVFQKIAVNGKNAHPLFKALKAQAPGVFGTAIIKWNFTKFLINQEGKVVKRYAPQVAPEEIRRDILSCLASQK